MKKFEPFTRLYKFIKYASLVFAIIERGNVGSPIIVDESGYVIDGNSRLRIAKALGFDVVPVVRIKSHIEYISPEELKETY